MEHMKKVFMFFLILLNLAVIGQTTDEINKIKSDLIKIFELSIKADYTNAEKFLAQEIDKGKVAGVDSKKPKEFKIIKRMCKSINALINISSVYEIKTPLSEIYNDIPTISVDVEFNSGKQVISKKFRFAKVEDKYLLLKID